MSDIHPTERETTTDDTPNPSLLEEARRSLRESLTRKHSMTDTEIEQEAEKEILRITERIRNHANSGFACTFIHIDTPPVRMRVMEHFKGEGFTISHPVYPTCIISW
jgi:hypothetical protein